MRMLSEVSAISVAEERDLDLLLLEELHVNPAFADWLGGQAGIGGFCTGCWHSLSDPVLGESDLIARFEDGGVTRLLLIENKIAAVEQPDQALRYRRRGRRLIEAGEAVGFRTMMIAPAAYLAGIGAGAYDLQLSLETLHDWFTAQGDPRSRWKAGILASAIARARRGAVTVPVPEITRWHLDYARMLVDWPRLTMKPVLGRAERNWLVLYPVPKPARFVQIDHLLRQGIVRLNISHALIPDLAAHLADCGQSGYRVRRHTTSSSAELATAPLDIDRPVAEQTEALRAALSQADRLAALWSVIRPAG